MIFDAHAHIYPDKLAARAVAALNGFYDFVCDGDGTYDDYTAACAVKAESRDFFCSELLRTHIRTVRSMHLLPNRCDAR